MHPTIIPDRSPMPSPVEIRFLKISDCLVFKKSDRTQPIPKFFKPSRPLIKFKIWLKLSTDGSFQLPERSISTGTHLQSALYGLQYRRIWMYVAFSWQAIFPTSYVCGHLIVKPLRGDNDEITTKSTLFAFDVIFKNLYLNQLLVSS